MAFLPSRQFTLTVGALVLTTASVAVAYAFSQDNPAASGSPALDGNLQAIASVSVELSDRLNAQDSDNDGLRDWEEDLWGTNPNNPDTDGDGTSDGDEVDKNRHPGIAGPNDKLDQETSFAYASDDANITDRFAKEVFSTYLRERSQGTPVTDSTQQALVQSFLSSTQQSNASAYTQADLTIINDTSSERVRAYGNALGAILYQHSFETENEAVILKRSLETGNRELIKQLDPIIEGYAKIVSDSAAVAVPQDAAELHIKYLNTLTSVQNTIAGMRVAYTDPAQALLSTRDYPNVALQLANIFQEMNAYFTTHDISFGSDEFGVMFSFPSQ